MTAGELDRQKVRAFAGRLLEIYSDGLLTLLINIGHELGLFAALASGSGTSEEVAARAGLQERYVREWLGAMVAANIASYDPDGQTYALPPEHAACLSGETIYNLAPRSAHAALLPAVLPGIKDAFRRGGGVPYSAFRPAFTELQDSGNRLRYRELLVHRYLPLVPGVVERLDAGARVADVGCGTGQCVNLIAQAFPRSTVMGFDFAEDAIARGRAESEALGLTNARFEVLDIRQLPLEPTFDVITAFDSIHDQADPAGVLQRIRHALADDGVFLMVDIKLSSNLEDNAGDTWAAYCYSMSVLHCMTVSLAQDGAGLGTMWGRQLAERMLNEAGFGDVDVKEIPGDPVNGLYICRP